MVIVRREQPADHGAVRAVHVMAFDRGEGEPAEARLVDELRRCDGWMAELSWVAESDDRVVGHNVSTRGFVGDVPCLGLGPIGVAPDRQGRGLGSALMYAMIGAADALDQPLIALLGDPAYYSRFGFVTSADVGIEPPEPVWGVHFQVLRLTAWTPSIAGEFRYATPFEHIS